MTDRPLSAALSEPRYCISCGHLLPESPERNAGARPPDILSCRECGAPIPRLGPESTAALCPNCGAATPLGSRFCQTCGGETREAAGVAPPLTPADALERAIAIALEAHAGQRDKAHAPYILHPLRLMLQMHGTEERIAAVLHDVVEDSRWTLEDLGVQGFSATVLEAVDRLTRRAGEDYFAFVRRAGEHPVSRAVKIADLRDNMDLSRIAQPTPTDLERIERYRRALELLLES